MATCIWYLQTHWTWSSFAWANWHQKSGLKCCHAVSSVVDVKVLWQMTFSFIVFHLYHCPYWAQTYLCAAYASVAQFDIKDRVMWTWEKWGKKTEYDGGEKQTDFCFRRGQISFMLFVGAEKTNRDSKDNGNKAVWLMHGLWSPYCV